MLLWLLFAVMTAAVLAVLLRPLARPDAGATTPAAAADIAVYKDQLVEIEADAARGLIQPAEAELARREVARRLLARADAEGATSSSQTAMPLRPVAMGLAALLPIAAIGSYLWLGAPQVPARPFIADKTAPADKASVAELVNRVEARLAQNPNDGQGWDVIAPVYFRQERFTDAANAYARAASILGETTQRLAGFAEATVLANNGIVTEPARLAYEKLLVAEPGRIEPRFWLALAKEQDGKRAEAAADYKAIIAAAPAGASWLALVEERLAAVTSSSAATAGGPRKPDAPRGPSAADVKAADSMTDADRSQMIRGMVDGLAKRLEANPNDVQGWLRLVQSYAVLGDRDKASAALTLARTKLAGDPAALGELATLAKTLGFGS